MPAQCPVVTSTRAAPYPVIFKVRNDGPAPVYFRRGCLLEFQISSCAAGYDDVLQNQIVCPVCPCAMPSCARVSCGACAEDHGLALGPGATEQLGWDGVHHAMPSGQNCVNDRILSAGRYRIRIPVYASAEAAVARQSPRVVVHDFDLPATGDVVNVALTAAAPADAGSPDTPAADGGGS
jgi:hypothetical protein